MRVVLACTLLSMMACGAPRGDQGQEDAIEQPSSVVPTAGSSSLGTAPAESSSVGMTAQDLLLRVRREGESPTKLALLVGINTYPNLSKFSQLQGAVNDVERVRTLLTTRYEFPTENVKVLLNGDATRDALLAAFRTHLIANARQGDIVVFHYSGHGSKLADQPGGDELDGLDETIVPTDSDRFGTRDIRDDEINELISELAEKTRNVTLIFDSCHSGTATRDVEGGRARSVDRDSLLQSTPAAGARGGARADGLGYADMDYVLLSGARANQQAKEFNKDGKTYGALSYFLTETLNQADASMTYADLFDIVQGRVTAHFANQSPQLEGTAADHIVFSDESGLAQPHVLVSPKEGSPRVTVHAGQVHGMTVGSVFDVYAPGTKRFEAPAAPVGQVKLTRIDPFESEAEVLSNSPIPAAARAVERKHVYPNLRMKLRYEGLARSATLRLAKESLDKLTHIQAVPEESGDFQLRLYEQDGRIHIRHDDVVFSEPVSVSEADAADHVIRQVEQWAKWFNVAALENATATATVALHLRFEHPDNNPVRASNEAREGATLLVSFENKSSKDLYITGIGLFATGGIQPFYPWPPGAGELLKAGTTSQELRIPDLTVPAGGRSFTRDLIKVFATTTPVNLSVLMQEGIRGDHDVNDLQEDPLGQLLLQATKGQTRDFGAPVGLGEWFTTQKAYVIRRNE